LPGLATWLTRAAGRPANGRPSRSLDLLIIFSSIKHTRPTAYNYSRSPLSDLSLLKNLGVVSLVCPSYTEVPQ